MHSGDEIQERDYVLSGYWVLLVSLLPFGETKRKINFGNNIQF